MGKKRCTAIILAGGSGKRMNSGVPKQYMELMGKPLIWYALRAVEDSSVIDDCILVTGAQDTTYVQKEIVTKYGFEKVGNITAGGKERYDSVYNALKIMADGGLKTLNTDGYVFIHDGARPFLNEEILERCYHAVEKYDACVTGMPVKDTVKIVDEENFAADTPDRNYVWQIQTPQVFQVPLIMKAYERLMLEKKQLQDKGVHITDDAMVVETLLHLPVKLIEGSYQNIKVTTPEDMEIAKAFLNRRLKKEAENLDGKFV